MRKKELARLLELPGLSNSDVSWQCARACEQVTPGQCRDGPLVVCSVPLAVGVRACVKNIGWRYSIVRIPGPERFCCVPAFSDVVHSFEMWLSPLLLELFSYRECVDDNLQLVSIANVATASFILPYALDFCVSKR